MVNFSDPAVQAREYLAMIKLWHTVGGIYIWEFVTTLHYEWDVIRGRIPYGWTTWVYSIARVSALLTVILRLFTMDITHPIDCQVVFSFSIVFSFLAMSSSSLLIVLRICAIWNRDKVAVAAAIGIWLMDVGFLIQGAVHFRAVWAPAQRTCIVVLSENNSLSLIFILVTDIVLLLMLVVGLYRLRRRHSSAFGLARLLWTQGVIWLLLASLAGIPPVVFMLLKLNSIFQVMFVLPSWIAMTIATTRLHRSLVNFADSESTCVSVTQSTPQTSRPPCLNSKQPAFDTIPPGRMELTVHVVTETDRVPQKGDGDSYTSTGEQMHEQLSHDDDVKRIV